MADSYIQNPGDGAGKKSQTHNNTVSGQSVHAMAVAAVTSAGVSCDPPSGTGLAVCGNANHDAADSGSPVKTGGKYNATLPSVTDGDRGDTQMDANCRTRVEVGSHQTTTITLANTTTAAVAGTTAETAVTGLGGYKSMTVYAALTGATGGDLNVYLQWSPDGGTTWVDYMRFSTVTAAAAIVYKVFSVSKCGQQTTIQTCGIGTSPAIAAGTVIGGDWGDRLRVVHVAGTGTSAGAALTIKATLTS